MRMLVGCFMDSQALCRDHPRCSAARDGDWACKGCGADLDDDGFCHGCDAVPFTMEQILEALERHGCKPTPITYPAMVIKS